MSPKTTPKKKKARILFGNVPFKTPLTLRGTLRAGVVTKRLDGEDSRIRESAFERRFRESLVLGSKRSKRLEEMYVQHKQRTQRPVESDKSQEWNAALERFY